jgi:hypothetical protein
MTLTPPSAPLSRRAGEGTGVRVGSRGPTACAVGYPLPPAPRAKSFHELLAVCLLKAESRQPFPGTCFHVLQYVDSRVG